jgi:amino acid transporter
LTSSASSGTSIWESLTKVYTRPATADDQAVMVMSGAFVVLMAVMMIVLCGAMLTVMFGQVRGFVGDADTDDPAPPVEV